MKIAVNNIQFETNQMQVDVPKDMTDVKLWLKEYDDREYNDYQAREAYVRTWLFENKALNYTVRADDNIIVLSKHAEQLWSLDALDQIHDEYMTVSVEIKHTVNHTMQAADDLIELFENDLSMIVFDQLRRQLPIKINIQ